MEAAIPLPVISLPSSITDWSTKSVGAISSFTLKCDVTNYMKYVYDFGSKFDFTVKSFGHAGDGNLYIYIYSNDMELDEFKKQVKEFFDEIYKKAAEMGGLISGEHGIGLGKRDYLADFSGEVSMRLMKGIKEVFDPKMILNFGKVCYKVD